jgi:hypothetical protein
MVVQSIINHAASVPPLEDLVQGVSRVGLTVEHEVGLQQVAEVVCEHSV